MTKIKFYDYIRENAPSPVCVELLDKLLETKFRSDPASYKHHHTYKHGLIVHSFELFKELQKLVKENSMDVSDETLFLIGFGHDLEKVGTYRFNFATKSYDYRFHKMFGMSHGEYGFNELEKKLGESFKSHPDYDLIKMCIYGHMGEYGRSNREKQYFKDNIEKCPLLWLTHMADMKSCELNGEEYKSMLEEENV